MPPLTLITLRPALAAVPQALPLRPPDRQMKATGLPDLASSGSFADSYLRIADELEKRTDGAFRIEVHGAGEFAKGPDIYPLIRKGVLPMAAKILAALSHWLAGYSGDAVEVRPDLDQVPALAVERDAQWRRVAEAEFLTPAEKRAMLGLPKLAEDG